MSEQFRPPPEPAHVSVIRQYEDLVAILRHLREGQEAIDQAFDRVASQIGFVFATTLPVTVTMHEGGKMERAALRGEHLQGTLFEKELMPVLEEQLNRPIRGAKEGSLQRGSHDFYVIWYEALKLKLGAINFRPPPEPAHFNVADLAQNLTQNLAQTFRPPPEPAHPALTAGLADKLAGRLAGSLAGIIFRPPPEPAHWFDPGALISEREQLLIVALDEVYGELKLLERINSFRQLQKQDG